MKNQGIVINEIYVEKCLCNGSKNGTLEQIEDELGCFIDLDLFDRVEMKYCYRYKMKKEICDKYLFSFLKEQNGNGSLGYTNESHLKKTYLCKSHQVYVEGYVFYQYTGYSFKEYMELLLGYLTRLSQSSSVNPLSRAIFFDLV